MSRLSNEEIRHGLRQLPGAPAPRPAEEFWQEFRSRASLVPQAEPAPRASGWGAAWWRWAATGGLAAAAVVLILVASLHPPASTPGADVVLSKVEQVDVHVEYDSMMIVEDSQHGGTVVWIAGVQNGTDG